ncbi:hypothetical protein [Mesorhizobium sp. Z1-4]|uniref:hypothetical protein n=1 Tax=Mesorhizobium sp. Z1-4 TaxID=2448478 RepID=UPI000FD70FBE|nr:hypothetical protein [Mesorhizobium sp. Z1-4]
MADRSILFSGPMVRALLDGRKTQTRRMLDLGCDEPPAFVRDGIVTAYDEHGAPYRWPRTHAIGDRLYVREAWRADSRLDECRPSLIADCEPVLYEEDGSVRPTKWTMREAGRYRHGRYMPRWASRLTLTVTDVRVQRVQEISRGDAMDEGCEFPNMADGPNPCDWFRDLWNSLNEKRGFGWEANPWVVALTFTVHRCNIDQMESDHA